MSLTYIIAKIESVMSVIAEVSVALIGTVAILLRSTIIIAIHIGPAAPLPCPPPWSGRVQALLQYAVESP